MTYLKIPLLISLLLAMVPLYAATNKPEIIELDRILAIANDDVITQSELAQRMKMVVYQLRQQKTQLPDEAVLRKQILERLIVEHLQLQLAKKAGIRINDETINRVIQNIAAQNQLSLEQFREVLQQDGFDFASFRENIRNEMTIAQLRKSQVENRITVTEQEIKNQLANKSNQEKLDIEFNLSHILIAVSESAGSEELARAHAKTKAILQQLKLGADFSQLAIAESSGQDALQGGQVGWRKAGQLPPMFAEMISTMQPGDISDIVRSPSGFHIIRLNDRRSTARQHIVEQTLARHILIKTSQLVSNDDARQKLARLRARILSGEDFAKLAQTHSADPGSAAKGGALGWSNPGTMVPRFEAEMNKLNPGEVSEPFLSQYGWHIVQVMSRRKQDNTQEYLRNEARKQIQRRKVDEAVRNWLRQLRDEAFVEYRTDE